MSTPDTSKPDPTARSRTPKDGSRPNSASGHRRGKSSQQGPGGNQGNKGSHGRKASAQNAPNRPSSRNKGDGNGAGAAPGEGDEAVKNLQNLIKSIPPSSKSGDEGTSPGGTRSNNNAGKHKKSASASAGSGSTLNPAAAGFQPGGLASIADTNLEDLVTPTASNFDLMAAQGGGGAQHGGPGGFRGNPNFPGGFGGPGLGNFRTGGGAGGFGPLAELPEEIPGFGGVAGLNSRAFSFPGNQQGGGNQGGGAMPGMAGMNQQMLAAALASGQTEQLLQAQQTLQLQAMTMAHMQAQLQQAQAQGNIPPRFHAQAQQQGGASPEEMAVAENLMIQQQLETLRGQQEALMQRLQEAQQQGAALQREAEGQQQQQQQQGGEQSPQQQARGGPPPAGIGRGGHRRHQSQQVPSAGGAGAFGGMGNFGMPGGPPSVSSNVPRGHGRRHSVNVINKNQQVSQPPLMGGGMGGPMGMGMPGMPFMGGFPGQNMAGDLEFGGMGGGRGGHHRTGSGNMSISGMPFPGGFNPTGMVNPNELAAAQSHLQQLAHFRASSGHGRVPSFGLSNPMNMMGGPQMGYGGQGGGGNQPLRKSLFAPYLPQASIPPLLATGKLVIGTLRVNKRNRSDAYVSTDSLDADIYICGSKDRNRALEGDVVAVELLDVDEVWGTKKEKEEKKRKKEENAYDTRTAQDMRKADKKKDDVEVEGQGLTLFEDEEVDDDRRPQFAGHVVAVVERMPGQLFSGTLGVLRPSSAATKEKQEAERREREGVDLQANDQHKDSKPRIVWFKPTDKRVPLIAIPTEQAPADFVDQPNKYVNQLFVACIKRWPITSLHPFGTLVEQLGGIGDIETETSALLKDSGFSAEDFTENVIKCLPPLPYDIPAREFEIRRDFRPNRVFTIDPTTAKDLDDALHVVKGEDGLYEVGVHIADVSHFIKPNTALDREARKRATTVYLVQKAVPMLPEGLSNELCSLNPGEDKLTFSVVFKMTEEGKIVSTWFGKSVINSTAKLSYGHAQDVIEGKALPDVKISGEHDATGVTEDIKVLHSLATHLRNRRFESGALRIDKIKINISLGGDGLPEDCSVEDRREANFLVEEFMLLANTSVAAKVAASLPEHALLRRHEGPIERRLEGFVKRAQRLGYDMDISSAGALMKSLKKVGDAMPTLVLQLLSTKAMQRAKYFCAGLLDIAKYMHYALNVPLYTHFTSPIRRYADVIVHRQLEALLLGSADVKFNMDPEAVNKVAQNCNTKRDAAKLAGEQSIHLYLCSLISDLTLRYGPVIRPATVIGVLDEAFDVLVPEFGIEKRVHVDQMPTENHVYDEHDHTLTIYWKPGVDPLKWLAETSNDSHLQLLRKRAEHHAKMMESQSGSAAAESALFEEDDEDDEEVAARKARPAPVGSEQYRKSQDKKTLKFDGANKTAAGHHVQVIKELQAVPVIVAADMSKSPPVLKILAVNPWA